MVVKSFTYPIDKNPKTVPAHLRLALFFLEEYIKNQLKEDELSEQLTFDTIDPFKG